MATTQPSAEATLRITRIYKASAQKVWEAWTRPEIMKRWKAPNPQMTCDVQADVRVGGRFRVAMKNPDGTEHIAVGTYKEVEPRSKLVYTWSWENDPQMASDTLVTVEFADKGGATEVVFTHELFPNAESRDKHNEGWTGCFARLEELF